MNTDKIDEETLTEEELTLLSTDDSTKLFLKEIYRYHLLPKEETVRLIEEYQNGNVEVRNKIVNHNLRLVVSIAKKYTFVTTSYTLLDLINEGSIGLMRAIETYDKDQGAFSTYATIWIEQAIKRSLESADRIIRRPVHIIQKSRDYKRLLSQYYEEHKNQPSDEYIKEELKINDDTLDYLKKEYHYNVVSIDKKIDDGDSESAELVDLIPAKNNDYNTSLENIDTFDLLNVIKSILTPIEYYVIYHRVLNDEQKTLEQIAKESAVTRERIRQIEEKALKRIKPFVNNNNHLYKERLDKLKDTHKNNYRRLKTEPLTSDDICIFLYLKDKLPDTEQQILYLTMMDQYNYKVDEIKEIMGINEEEFNIVISNLNKIMQKELNSSKFKRFKENLKKEKGTNIYNYKSIDKENIIDYNELSDRYSNITLEELEKNFGSKLNDLDEDDKKLIYKYYGKKQNINISSYLINREITLLLFGYKDRRKTVEAKKLYKTFNDNEDSFSDEQSFFLKAYVFNLKQKKEFLKKYPKSNLLQAGQGVIDRLERMYYGINRLSENDFNSTKYLLVRQKYFDKLGKEKTKILDLYYGINCKKKTIQEIADIYQTTYIEIHGKVRNAREYAINLYINRSQTINIDKNLYHKYILDPRFYMTDEARNILKLFIIENKTYNEIAKITKLSNTRISNIITDMIRKMDNYRFNLIQFDDYTLEDLDAFYLVCNDMFKDVEKQIIQDKYINGIENKEIAIKYNVALNEVNRIISRFNKLYFSYQIRNVKLTKRDVYEEVNKSLIESVTTEREKIILSYYYGIKNKYNVSGTKLNGNEICQKLDITKNIYHHVLNHGINSIKGRKINIIKPELLYIEKKELIEFLKDDHLPISEKEREIICYLFGLYNYPVKTLDELSKIYKDTLNSLKRRYMRSIVSILKYQNNEIEGFINYEIDIIPNLKYFPNGDRILLEDYYKNNMSYQQLAKKYKLTNNQIISIFDRLKAELHEMINNPKEAKFDFDFYEKNKCNPNLPFYGNISLADQAFRLYFGIDNVKRKTIPEIIKELNLQQETSAVHRMIFDYMLSICKFKDGIIKTDEFSYDDVKNYYLKHESEMITYIKNSYSGYFKRMDENPYSRKIKINDIILYDLLKEKYDNCFDVSKTDKEEVVRILKKYKKQINFHVKEQLMYLYDISDREFMSGKEINRVYKILDKLDRQLSLDKGKVYRK